MDLCEFNVEMKHRSGCMLHVPGMLGRLGYTVDHGKELAGLMHVATLGIAASGCKDSQLFARDVQQGRLRARMDAAGGPGEVAALYARLPSSEKGLGTVQESWRAEESSKAVDMCDMVVCVVAWSCTQLTVRCWVAARWRQRAGFAPSSAKQPGPAEMATATPDGIPSSTEAHTTKLDPTITNLAGARAAQNNQAFYPGVQPRPHLASRTGVGRSCWCSWQLGTKTQSRCVQHSLVLLLEKANFSLCQESRMSLYTQLAVLH